jgi:hypothetical protein
MEKNKSNKTKILISSIIGILALLLVLWLLFRFTASRKNTVPSETVSAKPAIVVPTEEPLVTPTIVPSSRSGWETFVFHDQNTQYSFEYPSSWSVVEIPHDNIVRLNFSGHCKLEFSTNVSDEEKSTTDRTKEFKTYAGRTFQVTTLTKNTIPSSETFFLEKSTTKDGFSLVTVVLPSSNVSQCQQTVDQILSSLTFGQ